MKLLRYYKKKEQPAEVIVMPKRRHYTWQAAASIIAIIGIGVFFLYQPNHANNSLVLASSKAVSKQKKDTPANEIAIPAAPLSQDSLASAANLSSPAKRKTTFESNKSTEKKETWEPDLTASALSAPPDEKMKMMSPERNDSNDRNKATTLNEAPSPVVMDTQNNAVITANQLDRKARISPANSWTTDKGKPFILSEIEVINVGKKTKKTTDTAAVKPKGGWQSFQEYLFGKLSKKDTADFTSTARFDGNLELEFSLTEGGSPYNIQVLHAKDSTVAKTAADAVQQGPKWITADKKGKRLNIKY